jgi:hypothetical protein
MQQDNYVNQPQVSPHVGVTSENAALNTANDLLNAGEREARTTKERERLAGLAEEKARNDAYLGQLAEQRQIVIEQRRLAGDNYMRQQYQKQVESEMRRVIARGEAIEREMRKKWWSIIAGVAALGGLVGLGIYVLFLKPKGAWL